MSDQTPEVIVITDVPATNENPAPAPAPKFYKSKKFVYGTAAATAALALVAFAKLRKSSAKDETESSEDGWTTVEIVTPEPTVDKDASNKK